MAIIKCPNCGESVSDKAAKCQHCGYIHPIQTAIEPAPMEESSPNKSKKKLIIVISLLCLAIVGIGAYYLLSDTSCPSESKEFLKVDARLVRNDQQFIEELENVGITVDTTGIICFEKENPEAFVKYVESLKDALYRRGISLHWGVRNIFKSNMTESQIKRLEDLYCLVDSNYIVTWGKLREALKESSERMCVNATFYMSDDGSHRGTHTPRKHIWITDGDEYLNFVGIPESRDFPLVCGLEFNGTNDHYYFTKEYKIIDEAQKQKLMAEYEERMNHFTDEEDKEETNKTESEEYEEETKAEECNPYYSETTEDDHVYTIGEVEQQPEFIGGEGAMMKWLSQNLHYPDKAAENKLQGRVIVSFIVEKNGTISDCYVSRSVDTELDNEALRVVKKMPTWESAKKDGISVRCKYVIPISFKLPNN